MQLRLILFLVFSAFFCRPTCAQKVTKRYFIGKWQSVDSSTGIREEVQFCRKGVLFFSKSDTSRWRYAIYDKDSIVDLRYVMSFKRAVLENEGTLVILSANCFWWFNPHDYDEYIKLLHNGFAITHKEQFEAWLKRRRGVCYRLNHCRN
jgi:hypothetical protein